MDNHWQSRNQLVVSAPVPDEGTISRTRKFLLASVWIAAALAIGASVAVAFKPRALESDGESLGAVLARENEHRTRTMIRSTFLAALDAARSIQKARDPGEVTEAARGAFLRSSEELFTLERTYGRERMIEEVGTGYDMAVRKLQSMIV